MNIDQGKGICRNCGQVVHDSSHVLWKCPVINKYRKHRDLCNIDPAALPKALQYGLPCTLSCELSNTCFGTVDLGQGDKEILGGPQPAKAKYMDAEDALLQDILQQKGINSKEVNARQAFRLLVQTPVCQCHLDVLWMHPQRPMYIRMAVGCTLTSPSSASGGLVSGGQEEQLSTSKGSSVSRLAKRSTK